MSVGAISRRCWAVAGCPTDRGLDRPPLRDRHSRETPLPYPNRQRACSDGQGGADGVHFDHDPAQCGRQHRNFKALCLIWSGGGLNADRTSNPLCNYETGGSFCDADPQLSH